MPESCIVIGHFYGSNDTANYWNEAAKHVKDLLSNKDIETISCYLDSDINEEDVANYIENDDFFIELIDNAIDIDGKKFSILLTNYTDNDATLEMIGWAVDACVDDYFDNMLD